MKKFKILTKPTRVQYLSDEEWLDELSSDWELKAERLIARRMRKLRREMA